MGAKLWYITGYLGDSDLTKYIYFDDRFGKESIEDMLCHYFNKKYQTVIINAKEAYKELV